MRSKLSTMAAGILVATVVAGAPAAAQKQGGTLKYYHRDNPPTTSIHEEATVSTVNPCMAVFNNLVLFDQGKPSNSLETIVPDLAESWSWSADNKQVTFKLRRGVKWHDGKPFGSMGSSKSPSSSRSRSPRSSLCWHRAIPRSIPVTFRRGRCARAPSGPDRSSSSSSGA